MIGVCLGYGGVTDNPTLTCTQHTKLSTGVEKQIKHEYEDARDDTGEADDADDCDNVIYETEAEDTKDEPLSDLSEEKDNIVSANNLAAADAEAQNTQTNNSYFQLEEAAQEMTMPATLIVLFVFFISHDSLPSFG